MSNLFTPLSVLLDSKQPYQYHVPIYQRQYVWGKKEWSALHDDLTFVAVISFVMYLAHPLLL